MLGHITLFCEEFLAKHWLSFSEDEQARLKLYLISIIYNNRAANNPNPKTVDDKAKNDKVKKNKAKNDKAKNDKAENNKAKNPFIDEAIIELKKYTNENVFYKQWCVRSQYS